MFIDKQAGRTAGFSCIIRYPQSHFNFQHYWFAIYGRIEVSQYDCEYDFEYDYNTVEHWRLAIGGFGLNKKNSGKYLCTFESWGYYSVGLTTKGTIIIQFWVSNLEWADETEIAQNNCVVRRRYGYFSELGRL